MGGFYIEAGLAAYACLVVYHLLLVGTAIIDARERRAPNLLVLIMLAFASLSLLLRQPASWAPVIVLTLAACGLLVALEVAWRRLRGSAGLGMGDIKVLGTAMLLDPWSALGGFIGSLAVLGATALALRKQSLPLLPFFCISFIAAELLLRVAA
ncbi:prepilin peptidase [Enorma phocaeensis]|uniref:prepilin peptidase n=1 Tax=Enorma phocaeensis TaxID=1871019 RepID=UPI003209B24D